MLNKLGNDQIEIVNTKKCAFFYTTKVDYITEIAEYLRERNIITFNIEENDELSNSLSNYLIKKELNDQLLITDMSLPKGYLYPKNLSESNADQIKKFISVITENQDELKKIDQLSTSINNLKPLFSEKSEEDKQMMDTLSNKLEKLNSEVNLGELEGLNDKLAELTIDYEALNQKLETCDKMFGSSKNFEVVNKSGERKLINDVIKDKTHILIYFSAHWCPPCRGFTPQLATAYNDATNKDFEIIFMSSDKDQESFNN